MHPEIADKNLQQMLAYREMTEDDLFTTQWVKVELPPEEFPGYKGGRAVCDSCCEGINFRREVRRDGKCSAAAARESGTTCQLEHLTKTKNHEGHEVTQRNSFVSLRALSG
jgi:hypothetical protein